MPELVETWAVVVGAGAGTRLAAGRPKAFVGLRRRPLLAYAVELFEDHAAVDGVVLVVPAGWEEPASLLVDDLAAGKVTAAVTGGATRVESVAAGLAAVPAGAGVILVHDAARPLASGALVDRVLGGLSRGDGVVPALRLADTVKEIRGETVERTLDRSRLVAVQTPQAFAADVLRRAYAGAADATDCAGLVERAGGTVVTVAGERRNLKVTDGEDLALAEALLP